ncbi:MAG: nickel-responsive transcriptional regulator NikR [Caldithrix sp.]|nr:nickel-responsive transcriptional regulator NikR [Caldithrix sp.]
MQNHLVRFGVSLQKSLIDRFDQLIRQKGYANRSEAIRDMIRERLIAEEIESDHQVVGILHLLYDHHKRELSERLTEIQHQAHDSVISSTHIHLDHDNCLEAIILKGRAKKIQELANKILATKGVKNGKLYVTSTGQDLA